LLKGADFLGGYRGGIQRTEGPTDPERRRSGQLLWRPVHGPLKFSAYEEINE
jgi:hypothetical protein